MKWKATISSILTLDFIDITEEIKAQIYFRQVKLLNTIHECSLLMKNGNGSRLIIINSTKFQKFIVTSGLNPD